MTFSFFSVSIFLSIVRKGKMTCTSKSGIGLCRHIGPCYPMPCAAHVSFTVDAWQDCKIPLSCKIPWEACADPVHYDP